MSTTDLGILRIVPLSSIDPDFTNRGRQIYTDIEGLAASIREQGLISPLTVYSPTGEPPYKLLAGGRRYLACTQLKLDTVSVRVYDHPLSDIEFRIVELYENTKRRDLDFAEQVAMTNAINELYIELKGQKVSHTTDAPGHSMRDTAKILGKSHGSIQQDIKLARAIKDLPELQLDKAKNKHAAMNTLRRMENLVRSQVSTPIVTNHTLAKSFIVGDFFTEGTKLPVCSFNFLEVDPPYGIDLHFTREAADKQVLNSEYEEIAREDYPEFILDLCAYCFTLAAEDSWIVLWHDMTWFTLVYNSLKKVGFQPNIKPAIWKKGDNPGQTQSPNTALGSSYESFTYARKGKAVLIKQGRSNIFDFTRVFSTDKIHPTERPAELMEEIINTFCWPGSNILVPFAGSGNTLIAGNKLGHRVVGFDKSEEFRQLFLQRIAR